jgi:hypothetical protein
MPRVVGIVALLIVLAGGRPTRLPGQEPDSAATLETVVEQIAGSTVYVPVGRADGLAAGDTVVAHRARDDVRLGLLLVVATTDDRASLTFADRAFPITRGDVLRLVPLGGRPEAVAAPAGAPVEAPDSLPAPRGEERRAVPRRSEPARSPRFTGSLGLDVDALRTSTRWGGPGVDPVNQTLAVPALRVRAAGTGLPLGLEAGISGRVAYRAAAGTAYEPARSVRVYDASLARRFSGVPLEVRVGRFWTRLSSIRSFWDGAMVRLGGAGLGVGGAVGWEPARGDEGFSTDTEKWSAFADYRHRGDQLSYATDISLIAERTAADDRERRSLGWAQRARWRGFLLSQRFELDLDPPAGAHALTRAFTDVGIPLTGELRLEGSYARDVLRWSTPFSDPVDAPTVERWSAGASWAGRAGSVVARAGRIREGDGRDGTSVDGAVHLTPWTPAVPGIGLVGAYWDDGDASSLYLSPSLSRSFGALDTRVAYLYYATRGVEPPRLHGAEASLDFPLTGGVNARLAGQGRWGDGVTTLRASSSLWVRFR